MTTATLAPESPQVLNLTVSRAADVSVLFALTNAAGNPYDLSQSSAQLSARDTYQGTLKIAPLVNTSTQHVDPINGKTAFVLPKATLQDPTGTQRAITWLYEVRLVTAANAVQVVCIGQLTILPSLNP